MLVCSRSLCLQIHLPFWNGNYFAAVEASVIWLWQPFETSGAASSSKRRLPVETLKNVTSRKFLTKVLLVFGREGIHFLETLGKILHSPFQHAFNPLCPTDFFLKVTGCWTTEMKSSLEQERSFTMRHHKEFNVLPTIPHRQAESKTFT